MLLWKFFSGGNIFPSTSQLKIFASTTMQVLIQDLLNPKILPTLLAVLLELVHLTCGYKQIYESR